MTLKGYFLCPKFKKKEYFKMRWFSEITSTNELRLEYKRLLMKHHPDNGGKVSDMQEINVEYDALFACIKAKREVDGHSSTHNENEENKAFKEVLNNIISYHMKIEVIGSWIWCFDCYAYKDRLKEIGFKFGAKKKAWCWHYGDYHRHHKTEISLDDIRAKYGSQKVTNEAKQHALN